MVSDNKKYYYIKLKDNYFDQDNIKVLESMKNGHTYSLILIKMYLRASKYNGRLMMTQAIPYEPDNIDILAGVLGHDVDHVKETIRLAVNLDLITIIDGREIWMTEIQNFIGQSSSEADRIRDYRRRLGEESLPPPEEVDVQMYDKCTPEIERELEIDKEIKKDLSAPKKRFQKPTIEEVTAYCKERGKGVDPHRFFDYYEANGWMVGRNKMKDWKSAVRYWERNTQADKHKGSKEGYSLDISAYRTI
jgi:predicted phage replisome organizer